MSASIWHVQGELLCLSAGVTVALGLGILIPFYSLFRPSDVIAVIERDAVPFLLRLDRYGGDGAAHFFAFERGLYTVSDFEFLFEEVKHCISRGTGRGCFQQTHHRLVSILAIYGFCVVCKYSAFVLDLVAIYGAVKSPLASRS